MPVSLVGCQIHKLFMLWCRLSLRGERWWGVSTECLSKALLSLFFLTVSFPFYVKRLRHRSDKGGSITFTKQVKLLFLLLLNHCLSFVTTQTSNGRSLRCLFAAQLFGGEGKHSGQSACLSSDEHMSLIWTGLISQDAVCDKIFILSNFTQFHHLLIFTLDKCAWSCFSLWHYSKFKYNCVR